MKDMEWDSNKTQNMKQNTKIMDTDPIGTGHRHDSSNYAIITSLYRAVYMVGRSVKSPDFLKSDLVAFIVY